MSTTEEDVIRGFEDITFETNAAPQNSFADIEFPATPEVAPVGFGDLEFTESTQDELDKVGPAEFTQMLQAAGELPAGFADATFRPPETISEADKKQALADGTKFLKTLSSLGILGLGKLGSPFASDERALRQGAAIVEESGRMPSALLEQVGEVATAFGASEDNTMLNLAEMLRSATKAPEFQDRDTFDDVFQGIVQTGTFAGGGRAGAEILGAGTKTAGAIAAWLGSAVGGQAGKEDAIRNGATEEQTDVAYWVNSVFGASEGFPIGLVLGRIDDMTGGFISKRLKSKAGQVIGSGLSSLVEETLQETFQTFGENWTAKDIAGYDPGRSLGDNMMAAATTGGSVGMLMGLVAGAIGVKRRADFDREVDEILQKSGANSIEEIAGEFVTLDDGYWALQREVVDIRQQIQESADKLDTDLAIRAQEAILTAQEEGKESHGRSRLDNIQPEPGRLAYVTGQPRDFGSTSSNAIWSFPVNTAAEGTETSILGRINNSVSPTIVAISSKQEEAKRMLPILKEQIKNAEKDSEQWHKLVEKKQRLQKLVKIEQDLAKNIKGIASKLIPNFTPGSRIVITDQGFSTLDRAGEAAVYLTPEGKRVYYVGLDTGGILALENALLQKPNVAAFREQLTHTQQQVVTTLAHEIGHNFIFDRFSALAERIRQKDPSVTKEELTTYRALQREYLQWVVDNINSTDVAGLAGLFSQPRFRRWASHWVSQDTGLSPTFLSGRDFQRVAEGHLGNLSLAKRIKNNMMNNLFSMDEFFAEELAKQYLQFGSRDTKGYFSDSLKGLRKIHAQMPGKFGTAVPSMRNYIRLLSMRGKIAEATKRSQEAVKDPITAAVEAGISDRDTLFRIKEELDVFNKFMDVGFNILQIAQKNPHIQGLQNYVKTMRSWKNNVNSTLAIAEDRLTEWKNLGKKENETLGRLLLDETLGRLPDGGWLKEPRVFTNAEVATYNLSPEALELRNKIKSDFRDSLARMERVLIAAKMRIFAGNIQQQTREVAQVQQEFKRLQSRPYFPLMRFGEFTLQVRAKKDLIFEGRKYKEDEIIEFQSFDTKRERDRALQKLRGSMGGEFNYSSSKMLQPNFSVQGMPLTLVDHLEKRLESTNLTDAQRKIFEQVKKDVLPFRSFRKQFQRRKGILGFSLDAQRSYANYMSSFANHIARVEFDQQFKDDLDSVRASISAINLKDKGDSTKRASILNHMNEHLNYVMNPVNEFVGVRSAAFFWYLGFNVKSAFVNLTQIPLVTYPYLAARFGDGRAVAQLTRAYKKAPLIFQKATEVDNAELGNLIKRGLEESWLDESLATELALAASEKNLDKSLPRKARQKLTQKLSHWGSLPFHTAEKLNRFVTAIAAFRLAKADGMSESAAIEEARRAVEKTQFEYARWARPKFQRGKFGGTVFVFQNYLQNVLFFALGGDPGAFRMVVMLFFMAGLMGIPFGENIADLVDAGLTALKKKAGVSDPHTAVRTDLREMFKEMEIDPDLVMHGLSSSSFGLSQLGEFMGWPIPDVDLSGSLSMGRVLPGTELISPGREQSFEKFLAGGSERAGGAIVSGIAGIAKAFFDTSPDQWKRWEKAMPAAMRQISKAARYQVRGEEATRAGYPIAGFDMNDTRDQAEVVMQSLGFTPREVSKGWESFIAQQQAITYYETWKTSLLRQWNYAHENKDKEDVKRMNAEIRKYNSAVPFPEMKIGPETRQRSYLSYLKSRKFNERRIEQSKRDRRLSSSIREIYEEAEDN